MNSLGLTTAVVAEAKLAAGWTEVPFVQNLAELTALHASDGLVVAVLGADEYYTFDAANTFTTDTLNIIAGDHGGRWFRRSKSFVIGNYTLWAQSYNFGLVGFTPGQQLVSSSAVPDIVLDLRSHKPASTNQQQIVIDYKGNPWVVFNNFTLGFSAQRYPIARASASGAPNPDVIITPPSPIDTECGYALFDQAANLWIAQGTHGTFGVAGWGRYSLGNYETTGAVPDSVLNVFSPGSVAPSTSNQQQSLFDASGNMWTSLAFTGNTGGTNGGIIMLTAAQLGVANPVPSVFWNGSNFSATGLGGTSGMALGANGMLYVADLVTAPGRIRAWSIAHTSGNPTPDIVLTCTLFNGPYGLIFDPSGNMWVSNGNNSKLMRIPAAQLAASGAVTPDVVLTPTGITLTSNIALPRDPQRSGPFAPLDDLA